MALTTVTDTETFIGLKNGKDRDFITLILPAVEAAFLKLIDRNIAEQVYTDYLSGTGKQILLLNEYPVSQPVLTGTLTSGSAVITGLSSTSRLGAGLTVTGTGVVSPQVSVTPPTTIVSVDSATQVTMSAAATASGTVPLTFSMTVNEDIDGYGGFATNSFPANQALIQGDDYIPVPDGRNGQIETGRLYRIGTVWNARWQSTRGLLTTARKPSAASVKVTYLAGYQTVPDDIRLLLWEVCAHIRIGRKRGWPVTSESYQGYSYALSLALNLMQLGFPEQLISRYRRSRIRQVMLS